MNSDITVYSPTTVDLLETSVDMLRHLRDRLDDLARLLPQLPAEREAVVALLREIDRAGGQCWGVMETFVSTVDCQGNA